MRGIQSISDFLFRVAAPDAWGMDIEIQAGAPVDILAASTINLFL
jgi:hypothetical protein